MYILLLFPTYVPSLPVPVLGLSLQSSPGSCARPVSPVISWFLCSACLSSHLQVPVSPVISRFLSSASLQSSPGSCLSSHLQVPVLGLSLPSSLWWWFSFVVFLSAVVTVLILSAGSFQSWWRFCQTWWPSTTWLSRHRANYPSCVIIDTNNTSLLTITSRQLMPLLHTTLLSIT